MNQNKMNQEQFETFLETALKRHAPKRRSSRRGRGRARAQAAERSAAAAESPALALAVGAARLAIRAGLAARRRWLAAPRSASSSALPGSIASLISQAPFAIANRADLGSVVFEPEPLTGARP